MRSMTLGTVSAFAMLSCSVTVPAIIVGIVARSPKLILLLIFVFLLTLYGYGLLYLLLMDQIAKHQKII